MKAFFFLFLSVFASSCGCYEFSKSLRKIVKPMSIIGEVKYKFVDSTDRNTPKIETVYGIVFSIHAYEMYDDIQPGDSIVKEAGSLKYILKRTGEKPREYYPQCDGEEIK